MTWARTGTSASTLLILIIVNLLLVATIPEITSAVENNYCVISENSKTHLQQYLNSKTYFTGQEVMIFYDDFEDDEIGKVPAEWEVAWGGKGYGVTNEVSHSGSKSVYCHGKPSWSCTLYRRFHSNARYIGFEAYVYITEPEHIDAYPDWGTWLVQFWCKECAAWGLGFAGVSVSFRKMVFQPGNINFKYRRWYHLKLILDRDAATYDVWINGVLVAKDVPVPEDRSNKLDLINSIAIFSEWTGAKIYYDDIRVFEVKNVGAQVTSTVTITSTVIRYYTCTSTRTTTMVRTVSSVATVTNVVTKSVPTWRTVTSTVTATRTVATTKTITVANVKGISQDALIISLVFLAIGFAAFIYGWRRSR